MELTPRTAEDVDDGGADSSGGGDPTGTRGGRPRRRWLPMAVLGLVLVAIGVFVTKGLSEATLYFRNADEAIAQRDELGTRRFRLQGSVVDEPVPGSGTIEFQVSYGGAVVDVHHTGNPPEMFRPGVPVVLEGAWSSSGDVFESDELMVKHDEEYESQEQYDERRRQADEGGDLRAGGEGPGQGGG